MPDSGVIRVNGQYRLGPVLANGASGMWLMNVPLFSSLHLVGEVYQACNISNNSLVAVKLEDSASDPSQVECEYAIYRKLGHQPGIPKVLWYGREGEYTALIMELLGTSLHEHTTKYGPCPLAMIVSVSIQVVCDL